MRATQAWKCSKSLLFITYFMSNFLTCCCCSQGRGPFLFHRAKHPFMRATRARKIQKYLLYCMISLSVFWLAPAVLQAGWPVYFIVRSTLSCEQLKLEKLKLFALLHDFLVYYLTCCCSMALSLWCIGGAFLVVCWWPCPCNVLVVQFIVCWWWSPCGVLVV